MLFPTPCSFRPSVGPSDWRGGQTDEQVRRYVLYSALQGQAAAAESHHAISLTLYREKREK